MLIASSLLVQRNRRRRTDRDWSRVKRHAPIAQSHRLIKFSSASIEKCFKPGRREQPEDIGATWSASSALLTAMAERPRAIYADCDLTHQGRGNDRWFL